MLPESLYFKTGGKKAVLLFHAYTGSPNDVRLLARMLERHGISVLAPLFSGHGTAEPLDILSIDPSSWWEDAERAVAFLQHEGFEQIAVFGLSMGGIFAMKTLSRFPAMVIGGGAFNSPLIPQQDTKIYPSFLEYCKLVYRRRKLPEEAVQEKIMQIKEPLKTQLGAIHDVTSQVVADFAQIHQDVFLAQSGKDEMIDALSVYRTGELLSHTNHEIFWYPEATHVITVGSNRYRFEADVLAFIEKLPWNEVKE